MTRTHYISFLAAVSIDQLQMVKLYPEGNAEARFKIRGVKKITGRMRLKYRRIFAIEFLMKKEKLYRFHLAKQDISNYNETGSHSKRSIRKARCGGWLQNTRKGANRNGKSD